MKTCQEIENAINEIKQKFKTCQEIENAINEIKQKFKKKKTPVSEKKKCKSEDPDFKCKECNCWKFTREICS